MHNCKRNGGDQLKAGAIGQGDGQWSCNRSHSALLLRGVPRLGCGARKSRAISAPTLKFYGPGETGSRTVEVQVRGGCDGASQTCALCEDETTEGLVIEPTHRPAASTRAQTGFRDRSIWHPSTRRQVGTRLEDVLSCALQTSPRSVVGHG